MQRNLPATHAPTATAVLLAACLLALAVPRSSLAQSELNLQGIASLAYAHSFQDTSLSGRSFNDGNGLDFRAGFQPGDWLAFTLGYQWQSGKDYDTHYFPVGVRAYAPPIAERVRFYGQGSVGLFFSRLSGKFGDEDNEKASAFQVGGGVEVEVVEDWGAYLDTTYTKGLGAANDYEAGVIGVGIVYRWDL